MKKIFCCESLLFLNSLERSTHSFSSETATFVNFYKEKPLVAGHEGYITQLSLVRLYSLSKPLLMPCWRQLLQNKCTETRLQFNCTAVPRIKSNVREGVALTPQV